MGRQKILNSWVGTLSPRHGVSWREVLWLQRVSGNILNKQSRTADKGWSSSTGLTTPHHKKFLLL